MVVTTHNIHNQGLDLAGLWLLVHVLDQVALALDAPVGNLADFLRVEGLPRLVVQVLIEGHDVDGVNEVDEGVTNVATIVQVQRQVKEVVAAFVVPVDALQEHVLGVLVGDVSDHDSGSRILTAKDAIQVNLELRVSILPSLFAVGYTALRVLRAICRVECAAS